MKSKIKSEKKIGSSFEIGERKFYPVVQISTIERENYFSESICPLALVVCESLRKYILPLTEDELDVDEIIKLVFADEDLKT